MRAHQGERGALAAACGCMRAVAAQQAASARLEKSCAAVRWGPSSIAPSSHVSLVSPASSWSGQSECCPSLSFRLCECASQMAALAAPSAPTRLAMPAGRVRRPLRRLVCAEQRREGSRGPQPPNAQAASGARKKDAQVRSERLAARPSGGTELCDRRCLQCCLATRHAPAPRHARSPRRSSSRSRSPGKRIGGGGHGAARAPPRLPPASLAASRPVAADRGAWERGMRPGWERASRSRPRPRPELACAGCTQRGWRAGPDMAPAPPISLCPSHLASLLLDCRRLAALLTAASLPPPARARSPDCPPAASARRSVVKRWAAPCEAWCWQVCVLGWRGLGCPLGGSLLCPSSAAARPPLPGLLPAAPAAPPNARAPLRRLASLRLPTTPPHHLPRGAGGATANPLTRHRAMPAVPLGSSLRMVDIPLNNCLQAGVNKM